MDDITKQIYIEKLITPINNYKNNADELFKLLNEFKPDEKDRFKIINRQILQRYYAGLISIKTLLENYKFYNPIKFSYATILRTMLLDFITIEFLYFKKSENQTSFEESLQGINKIPAAEAHRALKKNKYSDDKFIDWVLNLFPENFKKSGTKIEFKKSKSISPWDMAAFLEKQKYPYGFDAYGLYSQYSKIAHFSNMTNLVNQEKDKTELRNLAWSFYFIIQGHDRCLEILDFYPSPAVDIMKNRNYYLNLTREIQ